jgi:hypothetical protein
LQGPRVRHPFDHLPVPAGDGGQDPHTDIHSDPRHAAQVVSLATCRSRSSRWSWQDTRADSPYAATAGPAGTPGQTSTVRWFTRTAGTGNVPSRNHRYAVCRCTP